MACSFISPSGEVVDAKDLTDEQLREVFARYDDSWIYDLPPSEAADALLGEHGADTTEVVEHELWCAVKEDDKKQIGYFKAVLLALEKFPTDALNYPNVS